MHIERFVFLNYFRCTVSCAECGIVSLYPAGAHEPPEEHTDVVADIRRQAYHEHS